MADITKAVGAGVMVIAALATVAGIYQLSRRTPAAAPTPAELPATPPQKLDPRLAQEAQRREAERLLAEIRAERAAAAGGETQKQTPPPTRCVAGTLFVVEGNAWTNVGRC